MSSLEKRFPEPPLLKATCIFDLDCFPTENISDYGKDELEILLQRYGVDRTVLVDGKEVPCLKVVDAELCRDEWQSLKWNIHGESTRLLGNDRGWPLLFKEYKEMYPNILKLASVYLVLPVSTAIVERGFSIVNSGIKTQVRNRLLPETTEMLLYMSVNASTMFLHEAAHGRQQGKPLLNPAAKTILDRAKDLWSAAKKRMMRISY